MKKVLFISYQFPPRGGPGVHRSLNFVKNLRSFGYDPIVVTTDELTINAETKLKDINLLNQLPSDIKMIEISNQRNILFYKKLLKYRIYYPVWFICYPFMFDWSVIWALKAIPKLKKTVKENNISIVYTSSSPFSSWLIGFALKKSMNVKWVADLRDPFTDGYMWVFPSKLHWLFISWFERYMLKRADKVIVNTPEVKKLFVTKKGFEESKVTYITNGY